MAEGVQGQLDTAGFVGFPRVAKVDQQRKKDCFLTQYHQCGKLACLHVSETMSLESWCFLKIMLKTFHFIPSQKLLVWFSQPRSRCCSVDPACCSDTSGASCRHPAGPCDNVHQLWGLWLFFH